MEGIFASVNAEFICCTRVQVEAYFVWERMVLELDTYCRFASQFWVHILNLKHTFHIMGTHGYIFLKRAISNCQSVYAMSLWEHFFAQGEHLPHIIFRPSRSWVPTSFGNCYLWDLLYFGTYYRIINASLPCPCTQATFGRMYDVE